MSQAGVGRWNTSQALARYEMQKNNYSGQGKGDDQVHQILCIADINDGPFKQILIRSANATKHDNA